MVSVSAILLQQYSRATTSLVLKASTEHLHVGSRTLLVTKSLCIYLFQTNNNPSNVGFLRYWTVSNIPLFLIAIPILCLMLITAFIAIVDPTLLLSRTTNGTEHDTKVNETAAKSADEHRFAECLRCFALPQAVLALLTLTNFHVQIINRISSGYSVLYIVLAMAFTTADTVPAGGASSPPRTDTKSSVGMLVSRLRNRGVQRYVFTGMVLYAIVQGGLFASFLPPA